MGLIAQKNVLSEITVREVMRKQVICLPDTAYIDKAVSHFIKYKVNALMASDGSGVPVGVVSKTDIMGAYYAGLPLQTPLSDIMASPPIVCNIGDSLETVLDRMKTHGVYRLFIDNHGQIGGIISYPDIVGILYKMCYECKFSRQRRKSSDHTDSRLRFNVKDVMTESVKTADEDMSLTEVMEVLSAHRFGAVLITGGTGAPAGVVSKSDLMLAYKHGADAALPAKTIMSSPVRSCDETEYLETAIRILIFSQIQRLFVHQNTPDHIVGVLSLSDAARIRSGSCHACVSSRIRME